MPEVILTAVIAYILTSIDDLIIGALYFAQSRSHRDDLCICAGRYIGLGILISISCAGAFGFRFIPGRYIALLGTLPIALGIREYMHNRKKNSDETVAIISPRGILTGVILVTFANGADNIGVYIPLFSGYTPAGITAACIVFLTMAGIWNFLSKALANLPVLRNIITRRKRTIAPAIYILLGIYILLKGCI